MKNTTAIQMQGLSTETFIREGKRGVIVDVRSPGEYACGHIPGAINIPLFDDYERAEIGTLYKLKGKEEAVLRGIEIVSPKLADFIRSVKESGVQKDVHVYCFRGGMRSGSFCWLMETAGLKAYKLEGGYKKYRNAVLDIFKQKLPIILLGGSTGSGKTEVLQELAKLHAQMIDLEGLASHKGSAFGFIGMNNQPAQQQFENDLFRDLSRLNLTETIYLEDESFTIGSIRLPYDLWLQMKTAPIVKLKVPFELRVKRLVADYGNTSIEILKKPLQAIKTRLGPQHFKTAMEHLEKGEFDKVAEITLHYYDKAYDYNHEKRNYENVFVVETSSDDPSLNAKLVLDFVREQQIDKKIPMQHG